MNFKRKVQRNQIRKQVGNKNLQSMWNRKRQNVLLTEKSAIKKTINKLKKKKENTRYERSILRQINKSLYLANYDFKA